jgi:hypothetical protein
MPECLVRTHEPAHAVLTRRVTAAHARDVAATPGLPPTPVRSAAPRAAAAAEAIPNKPAGAAPVRTGDRRLIAVREPRVTPGRMP